ncbi:MAG: MBL fold metallo-hydrolase [Acinetobacter populi]|jgi:glyoxylase-like metal-dependent hydrolase (beta-lactamase superfamily II)|uniref:MBL fold metallo-hydrolase n=1 Tax=Acinetobacter populi TaxID=1582270 RepID=UPI0023567C6B|nr:MBL fold metallo-hydrolase [Acinetobacter populi]MCH4248605.1 MBL fold metallo-hydrolase [Acinetobacter populi]
MKKQCSFAIFLMCAGLASFNLYAKSSQTSAISSQQTQIPSYNELLLQRVRIAAETIPGNLPKEIRYTKFATSTRTFADTVAGGDKNIPYVQARTAYQVVYPDGSIMIDAGMDEKINEFFGTGENSSFDEAKNNHIQQALLKAKKIIITHEHGDHIAGVIRTPNFTQLAPKTIVTEDQIETLIKKPQMPELKLTEQQANSFNVVDFREFLPVAPGMVLIKAPGHTPGELMVYIKLQNGKEYIMAGDVSWSYVGVEKILQKPEHQIHRIGEDPVAIQAQLEWLNTLLNQKLIIVVSHDDIEQPKLIQQGLLKDGLI